MGRSFISGRSAINIPMRNSFLRRRRFLASCFACAVVVVVSLGLFKLVNYLLPLYRWEVQVVLPQYRVGKLEIIAPTSSQESLYSLTVTTPSDGVGLLARVPPSIEITSSTLYGHSVQNFLLIYLLVSILGTRDIRVLFVSWLCAVPCWLLVEMSDTPLVLAGSIQDLVYANFAKSQTSVLITWLRMQESGGRLALSVFAALVALMAGRCFCARRIRP